MTNRSYILGKSAQEYYKVTLFIPIIDHLVAELDLRFSQIQVSAVCGMYLIPKNVFEMADEHRDNTFKFFEWALPSRQTFNQELGVWGKMWQKASVSVPSKLASSLEACNQKCISKHLHMPSSLDDNPSEYSSNWVQSLLPTSCENKASINNGPEQDECTDAILHS